MSLNADFAHELQKHFTGDIRFDPASKIIYSTDASMYQIEPLGVAIPKTQDDLQSAVELAAKYKIPVLPRGAGSSLGGQAIGEALILDCSRWLDSIIDIDADAQTATVEPGVVLSALNAASARYGLIYGPDPASAERATMGGVIGNNATGAHSILYGMSADHLISADVILSDGTLETWDTNLRSKLSSTIEHIREKYADEIKASYPKSWRNSAGYRLNYLLPWSPSVPPRWDGKYYPANLHPNEWNLAPLLAGSEGTLAVMRRATVNLVAKPKHTILGVLSYRGIAEACDDVPRLLEFNPSAIELIPNMIMRLARSVPAYARQMGWIVGNPAAVLVVEFSGNQPSALKDAVRQLGDVLTVAESKEDQARVWNVRKMGLGILDSQPHAARPIAFIEDCAIPVDRLGEFIREVERILNEYHVEGGIYAHASAGCLHIRPVLNLQQADGVQVLRRISEQVLALTLRLGGSMSSEHGDGIATGEWIEKTYGKELTDAMRMLKQAADPNNLLNPNKMFDAPPMNSHLRFGESYHAQTWKPVLHFEHERGLAGEVEHCNGQGVCLKTNGVMCPSYQATREESNSTRGRANLLRGLISSSSIPQRDELIEPVAQALDLCLACKGCSAECPSGVDMAKLKYEFENEYYKTHRRPLRDYTFGYFHIFSKLFSLTAPILNTLVEVSFVKKIAAKILGITDQRPFPKFSTKRAVPNKYAQKISEAKYTKTIVFLSDPFSRYIEPQVEQAAFELLNACGYDVRVLPVLGAGASLLSKGFIDAAKRHAERVLNALDQIDPMKESMIVGIEPPEIYTLKNDYYGLLPDRADEIASRVAQTWLLDEYLLRSPAFSKLRIGTIGDSDYSIGKSQQKIKFQPHCHQRAEGLASDGLPSGANATVELLHQCGFDVDLLDTGCCGMAGTFGYEAEHYDLSMQIGELKLFPALREMKGTAQNVHAVGTGAACRMQIKQGTGLEIRHSIEFVRDVLLFSGEKKVQSR